MTTRIALAGLLLSGTWSLASDGRIEGKKLLIKGLSSGNKFIVKGTGFVLTNDVEGDPRCSAPGGGGGVLRVDGGGGNEFTVALPCGNWSARGRSEAHPNYRYRDTTQATCTRVTLVKTRNKLKAICKGPQVDYLLGTPQGDIAVTFELGSAPDRNCLLFGPAPTEVRKDGSDGRTYVAKKAPQPATCSPSGAFLD